MPKPLSEIEADGLGVSFFGLYPQLCEFGGSCVQLFFGLYPQLCALRLVILVGQCWEGGQCSMLVLLRDTGQYPPRTGSRSRSRRRREKRRHGRREARGQMPPCMPPCKVPRSISQCLLHPNATCRPLDTVETLRRACEESLLITVTEVFDPLTVFREHVWPL